MKKEIVCILLALLVLSGCSGKKNGETGTDTNNDTLVSSTENADSLGTDAEETDEDNETVSAEAAETIGVTIPPLPEEGIKDVPEENVKYTDESVIVYEDDKGLSYVNGYIVPPEVLGDIMEQIASKQNSSIMATATTASQSAPETIPAIVSPAETTAEPEDLPDITIPPDYVFPEETSRPEGTIVIEEEVFDLAKYVKTGDTELGITDVKIFNNSKPGVKGVDSFKPGDTMLINLWCDTTAALESKLYIVPKETDHKDSYESIECLYTYDMISAIEAGEGQLFIEITLPENVFPGVYELRFVCGSEEGYIRYHIG